MLKLEGPAAELLHLGSCALQPTSFFLTNKVLEIINCIAAGVLLATMVAVIAAFTWRGFRCRRKGMRW